MSSKRIYFRDVSQPFENSAAVRRWCVEYYDDVGTMFPVGMVWVAEIVGVGAQVSFVLVADEWRRNGIGKMLMESVKSRWPNIVVTGPMGDSGKALLDSVGLNDRDHQHRRSTAIHEAGHSVIAYRFHLSFGGVTIAPQDDSLAGCALTETEWADGSIDREIIVVDFAGASAELHDNPQADTGGSWSDEEHAFRLLSFQPAGSEGELRETAARMVADNWQHITAVAEALEDSERLTCFEVMAIVDAIDEGLDPREELLDYRRRCPPGCI